MRSFLAPILTYYNRKKVILNQVRKNNLVVYGGQAIKKQIGPLARSTSDYDILSSTSHKSAKKLEATLDRQSGGDYYYHKKGKNYGVWKVFHRGIDGRTGTKDDVHLADFSKSRPMKTVRIDGVRYAHLSSVIKDKKRSLRTKSEAFRHKKDGEDLQRIAAFKRYKGILR